MKVLLISLLMGLGVLLQVLVADLGEYQVILDKHLLGAPPVSREAVPVAVPASTVPPTWSLNYRMTMMTKDQADGTIRIGLQNIKDQTAVMLIEGRKRHQDFDLVSADYEDGTAQISFQGATHRFDLQTAPPPPKPATRSSRGRTSSPRGTSTRESSNTRTRQTSLGEGRTEQPAATSVRRFASQEELKQHLNTQQMDAIRTGKPPLPIPLTAEMDAQLVKEGVLPPQGNP